MKKPKLPSRCCGNCKHARPLIGSDTAVQCKGGPPTVTKVEGNQITAYWPLVAKVEPPCGIYAKRA